MWIVCVFIWVCVCVCVCGTSVKGRPLTFLCSSCLLSCCFVFGLSISTCRSELCSSLSLLASSCSTHRERGSRGEAHRGLKPSVFKGVSTPYFCIIHITPQRWSISRLQQQSWAISWRDVAAADTQTHLNANTVSSTFTARWEVGIVPVGRTCVWLHLKPLLLYWLVGSDPLTASRESTKYEMCERQKRGEIEPEMNMVREAGVKKKKKKERERQGKPPHPPALADTDL